MLQNRQGNGLQSPSSHLWTLGLQDEGLEQAAEEGASDG